MIDFRGKHLVAIAVMSVAAIGFVNTTNAATITTYLDRTTFDAAAGSTTIETFNSFVTETPFHTTPLDAGDFTISMGGTPNSTATASNRNKIDVPPVTFSAFDVNGTTQLNVFTHLGTSLILTFDAPVTVFGADFGQVDIGGSAMSILIDGQSTAPVLPNFSGFLGFTSDTSFSSIEFQGFVNDGWGIDDVTYSNSTVTQVPAPSGMTLLAMAISILHCSRRFRKRNWVLLKRDTMS